MQAIVVVTWIDALSALNAWPGGGVGIVTAQDGGPDAIRNSPLKK
jgi:hypothetical protein